MMHLFHIPQCITQNRNVHISALNDALLDMEQAHCGIWDWSFGKPLLEPVPDILIIKSWKLKLFSYKNSTFVITIDAFE